MREYMREEKGLWGKIPGWLKGVLSVVIILFIISLFVTIVPAGHRGVVLTWGAVEKFPMNEGLNFRMPVAQSVILMSVQTQKYTAGASSASEDLQIVSTEVTLNYRLLPMDTPKIYQELSIDFEDRIIQPAIQEAVKASTAKYTAEELITKRELAKDEIEKALTIRVEKFGGINVQSVSITDFDFSPEFNKAIEEKVTAEQDALKAKNVLERIKFEAEQRVTKARAEAEAIRIEAQALKENPQLVSLRWVEKWNGQLPTFMAGGGQVDFLVPIDIGEGGK